MKYFAVALFIILLSLNLVVFNVDFYRDNAECEGRCTEIRDYFIFGSLGNGFSDDELVHMHDVQELVHLGLILLLFLIPIVVFSSKRDFFIGGIISGGVTLLFLLFIYLDFNLAFTLFHKILFRNDLWLLPANSLLITMFPADFFYRAGVRIVLYISIFSGISIIGGLIKWQK